MATPLAKGLFIRAIGESGGAVRSHAAAERRSSRHRRRPRTVGLALAKASAPSRSRASAGVPADELVGAAAFRTQENVDGWVLPDEMHDDLRAEEAQQRAGDGRVERQRDDVACEPRDAAENDGRLSEADRGAYRICAAEFEACIRRQDATPTSPTRCSASARDTVFSLQMRTWARDDGRRRLEPPISISSATCRRRRAPEELQAFHAGEIPYVFNVVPSADPREAGIRLHRCRSRARRRDVELLDQLRAHRRSQWPWAAGVAALRSRERAVPRIRRCHQNRSSSATARARLPRRRSGPSGDAALAGVEIARAIEPTRAADRPRRRCRRGNARPPPHGGGRRHPASSGCDRLSAQGRFRVREGPSPTSAARSRIRCRRRRPNAYHEAVNRRATVGAAAAPSHRRAARRSEGGIRGADQRQAGRDQLHPEHQHRREPRRRRPRHRRKFDGNVVTDALHFEGALVHLMELKKQGLDVRVVMRRATGAST